MKTLKEMRELVKNGKAQVLTLTKAQELKGKEISTIYFGYAGQDEVRNFVVGDINNNYLYTAENTNTFMFLDLEGRFNCSDNDRYVYFVEE